MSIVIVSRWIFLLALLSVTVLAFMPTGQVAIGTGWDKANHLLAFVVLLGLLDNAYPAKPLWQRKVLPLLLYGVLIECVQAFLPHREFSLLDVLADGLGLLLYLIVRPLLIAKLPFIQIEEVKDK